MTDVHKYWIFDLRQTLQGLKVLPFDTFRVIPKKNRKHLAQLSRLCFVIEPSEDLCKGLNSFQMAKYEKIAMRRENRVKDKALPAGTTLAQAYMPLSHEDHLIFVPLRPKKREDGDVGLAYFGAKRWIAHASKKLSRFKLKTFSPGKDKDHANAHSDFYADVSLLVEGETMPPCVVCPQFSRKLRNPRHCFLGTQDCMTNVILPHVTSFNRKEKQAVLRSDFRDPKDLEGATCQLSNVTP